MHAHPEGQTRHEDVGSPPQSQPETFASVLQTYISQRTLLKGAASSRVLTYASSLLGADVEAADQGFTPLTHSTADQLLVPPGCEAQILIRWGDPIIADMPGFDPRGQTAAKQARQFGYNNDFIGFLPLPFGTCNSDHGLLVVNHEYTNAEQMFADWDGKLENKTREMVDIEIVAHGLAIIEVQRDSRGVWSYTFDSPYNRRLTAESPMALSGPAAGHPWLKTSYDSTGTLVRGTLNNCAAGTTAWGTVLTAEENFDTYFTAAIDKPLDASTQTIHKRYGLRDRYGWARFHDRFDVAKEPHEPLRFGWVVEVDPYDPRSVSIKRTALGRTKHEAAAVVIATGGQAVVYSGDDGQFEYLYKFVSSGRYDPTNRAANMGLLDAGMLYVAKFRDDGTGEWLPLIFGLGPLTPANSFHSQAEVLIHTRRAADLSGATKMDRPEDVKANPKTGKIYAVITNNIRRKPDQVDRANPRAENKLGHIIEWAEEGGEATASTFRWELFITCGNPHNPNDQTFYQGHTAASWMSCPDNVAFDDAGRLWVATDGQPSSIKKNDAVYVVEVEGHHRGRPSGQRKQASDRPSLRMPLLMCQSPRSVRLHEILDS